VYSTDLDGTNGVQDTRIAAIAVDGDGNAYVTGTTDESDFPTTAGAFDSSPPDQSEGTDGFVTKLNAAGSALSYSTFVGGDAGREEAADIAIDANGSAYVTGYTVAPDFPTTPGAFRTALAGGVDYFVTKLNATGSALTYSTYLGGTSAFEAGDAIAVDGDGHAYVAGSTTGHTFPTTPGAFRTFLLSGGATVTKFNPSGSAVLYSTYLGDGEVADMDVDAGGSTYMTGTAFSAFPVTPGALDQTFAGPRDAYMAKLHPSGSALLYSTYLGGQSTDNGYGIAVDSNGDAYVTGNTSANGFPTTPGSFQPTPSSTQYNEAFVTKLDPTPTGYPRPKSASPTIVSLVPAYSVCLAPNRQHGPPFDYDSCHPPARTSDEVTLGTPDANTKPAKGEGRVTFAALNGVPATPADEADVGVTFELTDVYDHPTLTDYVGELRARVALRITDKPNSDPADNATVTDTSLGVTVPCVATGDTTVGASCNLDTTMDAVIPGAVPESKRSVWEIGQVQVDDGGADGDADTLGDNTLFMVQGVFVP
jgi:hypothetical protein